MANNMTDSSPHMFAASDSQSPSSPPCRQREGPPKSRASVHWLRLRLAVRAIALLKHPAVSVVLDLDQLACEVESAPVQRQNSKQSGVSRAVSDYRLTENLFSRIARGSTADLKEVDALLLNDSKRYFGSREDAKSLVNHRSMNGKTLVYEAATQGNLAAVELLLRHGADLSRKSDIDGELETPLEAACRWSHVPVAELLLSRHKWTKEELKAAHRATRNPQLRGSITRVLGKARQACGCWG
jgi:hypothetical protein